MSRTEFRVRTYECDAYGHVNNAVYLHYLEMARYEFLRDIGFDYKALIANGYGIYISRVEIDYRKPAFIDDVLAVESEPLKKGAVSGVIGQRILRGGELVAEARVCWAFVGKEGAPVRIPAEFDLPGLAPERAAGR